MIRGISVSVGLLAVLALAGCAPAVATPTAAPTVAQTPSATPTPVATPTKPDEADLVVTPDGIAPLVIGQLVPEQPTDVAVMVWDASYCADPTIGVKPGDPTAGAWVANYPKDSTGYLAGLPFEVVTLNHARTAPIAGMLVTSTNLATPEGIHVGSTLAELKAAYPALKTGPHSSISDVFSIDGSAGTLIFEVANGLTARYWPAERVGTVLWMRIVPLGTEVDAIAGTDGLIICDRGE
jgi:hypothetical protein